MDDSGRSDYQTYLSSLTPERRAELFLSFSPSSETVTQTPFRQTEWSKVSKAQVEAIASLEQEIAHLELQLKRTSPSKRTTVTFADEPKTVDEHTILATPEHPKSRPANSNVSNPGAKAFSRDSHFVSPASDTERFDAIRYKDMTTPIIGDDQATSIFWQQLYWECKRVLGSCKRALQNATSEVAQLQEHANTVESNYLVEKRELQKQLSEQKVKTEEIMESKTRICEQLESSKSETKKHKEHCRQLEKVVASLRSVVVETESRTQATQKKTRVEKKLANELASSPTLGLESEPPTEFTQPDPEAQNLRAQLKKTQEELKSTKALADKLMDKNASLHNRQRQEMKETKEKMEAQTNELLGCVRRIKWLLHERGKLEQEIKSKNEYIVKIEQKLLSSAKHLRPSDKKAGRDVSCQTVLSIEGTLRLDENGQRFLVKKDPSTPKASPSRGTSRSPTKDRQESKELMQTLRYGAPDPLISYARDKGEGVVSELEKRLRKRNVDSHPHHRGRFADDQSRPSSSRSTNREEIQSLHRGSDSEDSFSFDDIEDYAEVLRGKYRYSDD